MRRLFQALLAAGIAVGLVGTAQAQTAADIADARCMVAIADMMDNPAADDPYKVDESGGMSQGFIMYYLGRIRGRNPTLPFDRLPLSDLVQVAKENRAAEIRRCFAQAAAIGQDLGQFAKASNAGRGGPAK